MEAQLLEGKRRRTSGGVGLPAPALHLVGSLGIAGCRGGMEKGSTALPNPSSPWPSHWCLYTTILLSLLHLSHSKTCPLFPTTPSSVPSSRYLGIDNPLLSNTTQPLVQAATVLCLDSFSSCQQLPLPPILPSPQPFYHYPTSAYKPEIWLCHFFFKIFLWFLMVKMSFKP